MKMSESYILVLLIYAATVLLSAAVGIEYFLEVVDATKINSDGWAVAVWFLLAGLMIATPIVNLGIVYYLHARILAKRGE